ncbi:uncharacterized protein LOC133203707 [Saccostrea echinata]|uniref:uncharacterized protein LOC133203707 n=1 Tax=Saccostrea echinata TaxID=191078 RepID=UPI002A809591|nr:uncharacterized protein LOC133203707 [Saccostrea echinata]
MMDNSTVTGLEMVHQDMYNNDTVMPELEGIWRRTSDPNEIEALFQMLKSELIESEGENQSMNNCIHRDQLSYLNSDQTSDDLLEEIFGFESQTNDCVFQNEAEEENQTILWDFDCSVFESKATVDENSNYESSADTQFQETTQI